MVAYDNVAIVRFKDLTFMASAEALVFEITIVQGATTGKRKKSFCTNSKDYSIGEFLYNRFKGANMYYTTNSTPIYGYDTSSSITINTDATSPYTTSTYYSYDYNTLKKEINESIEQYEKEKDKDMNLFKGFDFGSCENDNVKMSFYGIAVKNASGSYVSYDPATEKIFDVDVLNFNAKFLYKMPVAIKEVKPGDVVIHNCKPVFVTSVKDGKISAIDPAAGEEKILLLTHSPFGFDFVTKVINLFGNFNATATADQPFGNILPLIALSDDNSTDAILPFLLMGNNKEINPLMFYFLMNDNKSSKGSNDLLPLLFLTTNPNGFSLPTFGATTPVEKESNYKTE